MLYSILGGCPFHGRVERDEIPTRESPPKQSGTLPCPALPCPPLPSPPLHSRPLHYTPLPPLCLPAAVPLNAHCDLIPTDLLLAVWICIPTRHCDCSLVILPCDIGTRYGRTSATQRFWKLTPHWKSYKPLGTFTPG